MLRPRNGYISTRARLERLYSSVEPWLELLTLVLAIRLSSQTTAIRQNPGDGNAMY